MAKQHKKLSIAVAETQNQSTQIQQPAQEYREETAKLAYNLWQARGCPIGSPEEDWGKVEACNITVYLKRGHFPHGDARFYGFFPVFFRFQAIK